MRRHAWTLLHLSVGALILICAIGAIPASAQTTPSVNQNEWSTGVFGGIGLEPTQFLLGGQIESPNLSVSRHLTFRPNALLGFGDDTVFFGGNLDVVYWARLPNTDWNLYFGGGPGVVFAHESVDDCPDDLDCGESETGGNASLVTGVQNGRGLFIQLRASSRAHSLQATVGLVLGRRP
jgi:hypothetical protein